MLRNYIRTAQRFFRKHITFSVVNLLGLAIGFTVCYFAFLYVNFELSFDSFHKNSDNIYRLVTDVKTADGIDYRGSSAPIGPVLKEVFPQVESVTRILLDYLIIENDKGLYNEEKIAYADSTVFSVFTFPLSIGTQSQVFAAPFNVVLTESCASKYFGNENPIGKTLLINGKDRAYVTGVMKDIPRNSHFQVSMLVSMSTLLEVWNPSLENNWTYLRFYTYLVLRNKEYINELSQKLTSLMTDHSRRNEVEYYLSLEPLKRIYLHGKARGHRAGSALTGNISNVYIFSTVTLIVLFLACLNFINLSTAFSMQRVKEIGIRKVLGASRVELIVQFLMDAIIFSIAAFIFALMLTGLLLPLFNQISDKTISAGMLVHPDYVGFLFVVCLCVGVISGLYPAFFLSGFQAAESLRGRFSSNTKGIRLKKIIVTTQFLVSFVLLVATIVVGKQLYFMENQHPGFNKDPMLAIDFQFDEIAGNEVTKDQLSRLTGILMVSSSSSLPGKPNHKLNTSLEASSGEIRELYVDTYFIDYVFLQQYGIEIVAGRYFSNHIVSDSANAMIINEACAKLLGYSSSKDIIGKRFSQWGRDGVIIGVVKNFHFQSFREEVQPLTFQIGGLSTFITLSISDKQLPSIISKIENKWSQVVPDVPMIYFFTDEAYSLMYHSDRRFSKLFICFVIIAVIIACLGLYGLYTFSTIQRTAEIGIRKVLGSSTFGIVALLIQDFLKLIGWACLFGVPIAWFIMNKWLQNFAYRIDLSFWIFLLGGSMLVLIALLTIFAQTIRAANADLVRSLKAD